MKPVSERREHDQTAGGLVTVARLVLTVVGIAVVGVCLIPYEMAKSLADSRAADGTAEFYSPAIHARLTWLAACFGIAIVSGAAFWRPIARSLTPAFSRSLRDVAEAARIVADSLKDGRNWATLGAIVAFALAVRIPYLAQPVRYDEAYTYLNFTVQPWYFCVSRYVAPNNHVFHSLLTNISQAVFGDSLIALRLPAFIAGTLVAPAAYLAARSAALSKSVAFSAALLVACAAPMVEYSVNARGYTIVSLLVLLSVVSAQFACRKGSLAAWSATAVLFALAMWCIPIAVYYVAGIVFWMTLAPFVVRSNESMLRADRRYFLNVAFAVVAAVLLTLILYSPILAVDGLSAVTGNQFVQPSPIGEVVAGLPELARATISDWTRDLPAPGGLVLFVGLAIAVWSWRSPKAFPFLAPAIVLPPLLLLQRVLPYPRVWLPLLPLVAIAAAMGIETAVGKATKTRYQVLTVATAAAIALSQTATMIRSESVVTSELPVAESIADDLRTLPEPDHLLANWPGDYCLRYYLYRKQPAALETMPSPGLPLESHSGTVYVLINRHWGDTLPGVLAEFSAECLLDRTARPLHVYGDQAELIALED